MHNRDYVDFMNIVLFVDGNETVTTIDFCKVNNVVTGNEQNYVHVNICRLIIIMYTWCPSNVCSIHRY